MFLHLGALARVALQPWLIRGCRVDVLLKIREFVGREWKPQKSLGEGFIIGCRHDVKMLKLESTLCSSSSWWRSPNSCLLERILKKSQFMPKSEFMPVGENLEEVPI